MAKTSCWQNVIRLTLLLAIIINGLICFELPLFNGQLICNARVCRRQTSPFSSSFTSRSTSSRPVAITKDVRTFSLGDKRECPTGTCQYYYNCKQQISRPSKFCSLDNGFTGVCCKDNVVTSQKPSIRKWDVRAENVHAAQLIKQLENLEDELLRNEIVPKQNTKEFSHQNFFGGNRQALKEMHYAQQVLETFLSYAKREGLSPEDIWDSNMEIRNTYLAGLCEQVPSCANTYYRTVDGTCNNLINPLQGKAVSTFTRLMTTDYSDGLNEPRRAKDGTDLPNARLISLSISPEAMIENDFYSLLLMQFGQFIDHDLTRTAITRTHDNNKISCCDEKVLRNPRLLHPACYSIPVPQEDNFLLAESQFCINFVRSAPAINPKCRFGVREQLNQLSSYLDGNNIYGASIKEAASLRAFRGGKMKVTYVHNKEFPPTKNNQTDFNCNIPKNSNMQCFVGGDMRANEIPDLVVLHTVWLREHNRIATHLAKLNPSWNDEVLYQETRRIVIAEYQHIIYNEFLPLIIGMKSVEHFNLLLSPMFSDSYNPAVDASILNEFSTAAYRLHSLVQGTINIYAPDDRVIGTLLLRDVFSNPSILYENGAYEMRIVGLTNQAIHHFDNFFSKEVTHHLFQIPGKRFGLDLVALNIQRGRDHGIPGYVNYREICGLSKVRSFHDLKSIFSNPQVADVMSQLYRNVEDIDLFIAGTSEKNLPGALVGPTFACIIGEQFRRIKEGDRFWYENGNLDTSFTQAQLVEIKKASFSRILCDNSDVEKMQPYALLMTNNRNPKVECDRLPVINLNQWRQF